MMKRLFQRFRKRYAWKEPKLFLQIVNEQSEKRIKWWTQTAWVLVFTCLFMLNWLAAKLNPDKKPIDFGSAISISLLGGLICTYVLPWLVSKCPSNVTVLENCIQRSRGNRSSNWKFKDVCSYSWLSRPEFNTLVLSLKAGQRIFIGVPLDQSVDQLSGFFEERGLTKTVDIPELEQLETLLKL